MLNDLYNQIREENRFSDVFKPISREEMTKREEERRIETELKLKKRLEDDFLYISRIAGEVSWTYDEYEEAEGLAGVLEMTINDALDDEGDKVILDVSTSNLRKTMVSDEEAVWNYNTTGTFSGVVCIISYEEFDESDVKNTIISYVESGEEDMHKEGALEISNVQISELEELGEEDISRVSPFFVGRL